MELEFYGAAGRITGSCHILRINGRVGKVVKTTNLLRWLRRFVTAPHVCPVL